MWEITPSVYFDRNKLKLCFQKINCPCELTFEACNNLSTARPKILAKFKLKTFNWKYSGLKNCKIKNVDWQTKKQINTEVKLQFEKTNYKIFKTFYQKSHLIAQRLLSRQFHKQLRPCIFCFWKLISSLVENYWFQFGNKVYWSWRKQKKNILKDTVRDLKMIGVGK